MKYTYSLDDISFTTNAKSDFNASLQLKGMSISVEFSCDELTAVGQCALAMKNAATEACQKLLPIIKDSIIEVGKAGSEELMKHRRFENENMESQKEMETFRFDLRAKEIKANHENDLEIAKIRYGKSE